MWSRLCGCGLDPHDRDAGHVPRQRRGCAEPAMGSTPLGGRACRCWSGVSSSWRARRSRSWHTCDATAQGGSAPQALPRLTLRRPPPDAPDRHRRRAGGRAPGPSAGSSSSSAKRGCDPATKATRDSPLANWAHRSIVTGAPWDGDGLAWHGPQLRYWRWALRPTTLLSQRP